jgi:ABC-type nitrate/sulfonate/bicarbonate transport system substrate-binding protein
MVKRRKHGLAALLALVALAGAGCGGSSDDGGERSDGGDAGAQLDLFVPNGTTAWNLYLADKQGAFEKAGVNLKITPFTSGAEASEAVRAQGGELLEAGELSSVRFLGDGGFTTIAQLTGGTGLSFVAGEEIRSPVDLAGKKIAVNQGSTTEFHLDRYLEDNDLAGRVEITYLDPGSQPPALLKGDVDAAAMFKEQAVTILAAGGFRELTTWPSSMMLAVADSVLADRRDDVAKLLAAIDDAGAQIAEDPRGALAEVSGLQGLTDEQYEVQLRSAELDYRPQFTQATADLTNEMIDWLKAKDELEQSFELCDAYDLSLLKETLPDARVDDPCA